MGTRSGPVDWFLLSRDDARAAAALIRYAVAYLRRVNGSAPAGAVALAAELDRFARTSSPQASATGEHANLPGGPDAQPAPGADLSDSFANSPVITVSGTQDVAM